MHVAVATDTSRKKLRHPGLINLQHILVETRLQVRHIRPVLARAQPELEPAEHVGTGVDGGVDVCPGCEGSLWRELGVLSGVLILREAPEGVPTRSAFSVGLLPLELKQTEGTCDEKRKVCTVCSLCVTVLSL